MIVIHYRWHIVTTVKNVEIFCGFIYLCLLNMSH